MSALTFRRRQTRDDNALLALFNGDSFQQSASVTTPFVSLVEMRQWLAGLGAENCEIVAECEGVFAGFAGIYALDGRQDHVGWFFLGVDEPFQGRGVGGELLSRLIDAADVLMGLTRLQLTVFVDNEAALRLYRKHDFVVEGRHAALARRGEDFVDVYTMAKILPGALGASAGATYFDRVRRLKSIWSNS